ncbi:MAG TPA: hypothetical protein VLA88_02125 [Candidatus Saccharimonadales bacterium]|nr:hypothetical protein [Candidatus Saccharimonadales bacterium]
MTQSSPIKPSNYNENGAKIRFLAYANILPVAAVLMTYIPWLLPVDFSLKIGLLALGLVVAVINLIFVPRLVNFHEGLSSVRALTGAAVIALSVAYIAWVLYLAYGIATKI